jgi:hypothetical protein
MRNIIIASFSFLLLIGCQKEQSKKDRFDWAQGNFEVKFSPNKPDFLEKIKPDITKFYQEMDRFCLKGMRDMLIFR